MPVKVRSKIKYGKWQDIEVDDDIKTVVEDDKLKVTEFDIKESEFTKTNTQVLGMVKTRNLEIQIENINPQHICVVNAWSGKIIHGTPLIAGCAEGLKGIILSNAMRFFDFLGKEIQLSFDEDLYYEEFMKRVAISKNEVNVTATFADTNGTYGSAKI